MKRTVIKADTTANLGHALSVLKQTTILLDDGRWISVDPGIADIVIVLNSYGIQTEMSCEGHFLKYITKSGLFLGIPYVSISSKSFKEHERFFMEKLLLKFNWEIEVVCRYCGYGQLSYFLLFRVKKSRLPKIAEKLDKVLKEYFEEIDPLGD